jgi:myo-inositol-1(or 4)-monophosphatase
MPTPPPLPDEATPRLELAIRLAREAGALQKKRYGTALRIATKSASVDLVTEVDEACEALIVGAIEAERPGDAILAEEGSGTDHPGAAWRWVVDPLDGTTNYAHSYPRFCVSIGIEYQGEPAIGVVFDPLLDELYTAVRGGGALLNGSPIKVSSETELTRSLLATGFAYDRRKSEQDNLVQFATFLKAARALRRDGSAALDLCYVAAGRFEGFWEFKLAPWDVAAGGLIVREAGGRVSDADGGESWRSGTMVVASNHAIHEDMLRVLREAGR